MARYGLTFDPGRSDIHLNKLDSLLLSSPLILREQRNVAII